jgi:hypothetical protein
MPPECPTCLSAHDWREPCETRGMLKRLRERVREQEAELRALRALARPSYMPTESVSVPAITTTLCNHSAGICNACAPTT